MRRRKLNTIDLFLASGEETKDIRKEIVTTLKKLSRGHEKNGFDFQVQWWEDESGAVPESRRSQDEYSKLIDKSDMVAVIIKNRVGKYTEEEFNYALKLFQKTCESPKIVVYTLPTGDDDESRFKFVKKLRSGEFDYFHQKVKNEQDLYLQVISELLRIKEDKEAELKEEIAGVEEMVSRRNIDSELTREALELFENGNYSKALNVLDMDVIHKSARKLSASQKEMANAFVLRARLELTDIKNENRFANAEKLFDEALAASRTSEIMFEYAYYCQKQNEYNKAIALYEEALRLFRKPAEGNSDSKEHQELYDLINQELEYIRNISE